MFGRNRRLATKHTVDAMRPLIAIVQSLYGIPPGFWRDDFVLGFMGFMVSFHVNFTSGRTLSTADKGYLLADVFTALSNMNGAEISRDYTHRATLAANNPDFERGADNAAICALASIGKMNEQGMPHYERATEIAAKQGSQGDPGAVVAILMQQLFCEPIRERFSTG